MVTSRSPVLRGALAVCLLASTGCDVQTANAPAGDLTLYATFDDVQDLTRGHYVQMSDVVVGSVGMLELRDRRAHVRLDIDQSREVPKGTRAVVRRTSLLGEHYVELVVPDGFVPGAGPRLEDDDEITETSSQLELEELAARAGDVIGAIEARALTETIDAADRALGGRGPVLNAIISQTSDVVGALRAQEASLGRTIDAVAALGERFAPESAEIGSLLDSMAAATETVAASRGRAVLAAESLVGAVDAVNASVLEPQADRIAALIADADPVLVAVASRASALRDLFVDIDFFNRVFPEVQANGQVLIQAWLDPFVLVGGLENLDVTDPASILRALLNSLL